MSSSSSSSPCTCAVITDAPGTPCTLCGGRVPANISDADGDKLAIFQKATSRKSILSLQIAPADWTEEIHASFVKKLWEEWKPYPITCEEDLEDDVVDGVYEIVHKKFKEEYGDLLKEIDPTVYIGDLYTERVLRGRKNFHQWLGKKLRFKSFCARFYDTLRERNNVSEAEMWEEFEKLYANKWTFDQYALELNKKMKK